MSSVEPGITGQLAIYGTYLTAGGQDLSPTVTATNGITITGLTSIQDGQLNVSYNATNATPGTAYVTVKTNVGQTSPPMGGIQVGDLTPTITNVYCAGTQTVCTTYVVGVPQALTVTGTHLGTDCPKLQFPFSISSYTTSACTDPSFALSFTASGSGSGTINLAAEGYGGLPFEPGSGQGSGASTPTVNASNFSLSIQQNPNVSTGDISDTISVTGTPGNFTPILSVLSTSNVHGTCAASLSFPNPPTGSGTLYAPVTANGGGSCSGLFSIHAGAWGAVSQPTNLAVPPQVMIQTEVSEAGGQTNPLDETMVALLLTAYYRFGDPLFSSPSTWYSALTAQGQYTQSSTSNGVQPELNNAGSVFSVINGAVPTNIDGCEGYWSPTPAQWVTLQGWYNIAANLISDTQGSQSWSAVGAPGLWLGKPKQAVVKGSFLNNTRPGYTAIVLFHLAPSPSVPAVIAIP